MDTGATITYRGLSYRRQAGRRYYFASSWAVARHGRSSLHRDVYADEVGPIPPGHHVHHLDGDTENNDPRNLGALAASDHARLHYDERRDAIAAGRRRWEATDGAKRTKRAAIAKAQDATRARAGTCAHCRDPFRGGGRYCSRSCQEAARRTRNLRPCPICGAMFGGQLTGANVARTCSYKCGWELRRRDGLRAHG